MLIDYEIIADRQQDLAARTTSSVGEITIARAFLLAALLARISVSLDYTELGYLLITLQLNIVGISGYLGIETHLRSTSNVIPPGGQAALSLALNIWLLQCDNISAQVLL